MGICVLYEKLICIIDDLIDEIMRMKSSNVHLSHFELLELKTTNNSRQQQQQQQHHILHHGYDFDQDD